MGVAPGGAGPLPQIRNPMTTFFMLFIPVYGLIVLITMLQELKNFTQDPGFKWWGFLIPCYGFYWLLFVVPQQVSKAKMMAGSLRPVRGLLHYWFIPGYALAADLNEVADPNRVG